MATLQNARQHDLISSGVTLRPGVNTVSDEQLVGLSNDPQFKSWVGLGWVGIVKYDEAQLRALQAEAAAKEKAAQAEREAATAKTAVANQQRVVSQRENELDAELRRAHQRIEEKKAGGPFAAAQQQPPAQQKVGQYPAPPNEQGQPQHSQDSAGVAPMHGTPLTAQQPGTLTGPQPVVPAVGPAPGGHSNAQSLQSADSAAHDSSVEGRSAQAEHAHQAAERSEVASKNEQAARDAGAKSESSKGGKR